MTELRGGEKVIILRNSQPMQTFERTMSDALQRFVESEQDPQCDIIDLWRLITPMRRRQAKKYPPIPNVDLGAPLAEQIRQADERLRRIEGLGRVNGSVRGVKTTKFISDDTFIEFYRLRLLGIDSDGEVRTIKLWGILDDIARTSTSKTTTIQAEELYRRIRAREQPH